jgi:ribosomal protein S18 acetylase RimI-like enzyme
MLGCENAVEFYRTSAVEYLLAETRMGGSGHLKIRVAVVGDARAIAEVQVRAWQEAYREILPAHVLHALSVEARASTWAERIAAGSSILVVEEDGAIAGWTFFGACRDADAIPGEGEVYAIYVAPDRWSRGVGTVLWHEASGILRAGGCQIVSLWVFEANDRARRFYEHLGFTAEPGARKLYVRDGATAPEIRYRRAIAGASANPPLQPTGSAGS